jgi:hypothetical protein
MRWQLACAAALLLVAVVPACSSDTDDPGQTGTPACTAISPLKKNADQGCECDSQCESGHCFQGNMQSFCSVPCDAQNVTTVCVAPFTGTCNKQGFCKRD